MSNQGWQDGGVKSKKLEYGSKGVMGGDRVLELWSSAGPEAGAPRKAREAGGGGQKAGSFRTGTMEKRVNLGKGGQEMGKRTGFAHFETALTRLFPHVSTQVVDFPCMCDVGLFHERPETAEFRQGNDRQRNGQAGLGTVMGNGVLECWSIGNEGDRKRAEPFT